VLLAELARTSNEVAATAGRTAKIERLAACLRALAPAERAIGARYLAGEVGQGKLGVGHALLSSTLDGVPAARAPTLGVLDVDRALTVLAAIGGAGSQRARRARLGGLFAAATADERALLAGLIAGGLRQGAEAGVLVEAIAKTAGLPAAVRAAHMRAGDLGLVADAALTDGAAGLARFAIQLFRPLLPMLASPAEDVDDVIAQLGTAAFETKLDGVRLQLHRDGDEVRVFTRGLHDVTALVPEVVALARTLPVRRAILDGEAIALRADRRPWPFQTTMRRFGRRGDDPGLRAELPLSLALFDALVVDDRELVGDPYTTRVALLDEVAPALVLPRMVTDDRQRAQAFLADALARGHEGAMAKALDSPYDAGRRGACWLKLKRAHRLDLVVLAAEWGSGRRTGLLSNLHLGARAPATGGFVMLGKTFKGLTDELLAWQTRELSARAVARDRHVVHVRPELVVEIELADVQRSPHYRPLPRRQAGQRGRHHRRGARDRDRGRRGRAIARGPSARANHGPGNPAFASFWRICAGRLAIHDRQLLLALSHVPMSYSLRGSAIRAGWIWSWIALARSTRSIASKVAAASRSRAANSALHSTFSRHLRATRPCGPNGSTSLAIVWSRPDGRKCQRPLLGSW
jgi:DNA ligase-1